MSGLKEIRRHTWHLTGAASGKLACVTVQELQQFAAGYIPLPEQSLHTLTNFIWHGRKRYDPVSDTLIDIPTCM